MILRGERIVLRPGRPDDAGRLLEILNEPNVQKWWGPFDADDVAEQFVGSETALAIEVDGDVVGAIQFDEEEDPMYRHAGLDIFVSSSHQGRGLGTEAIRVLIRHLISERGHHRLTIDPRADNYQAIRAYEHVGFRRVGVLRKYELHPDGIWHDGLFMELLAEDFVDSAAQG
jgi:aminoglycoside 6'-N-acetyltransferase